MHAVRARKGETHSPVQRSGHSYEIHTAVRQAGALRQACAVGDIGLWRAVLDLLLTAIHRPYLQPDRRLE